MAIEQLEDARGRRSALENASSARGTHAGLWLDKYLEVMKPTSDDGKRKIRELIEEAAAVGVPEGYRRAVERREALLRGLDGGFEGGVTHVFTARSRGRSVVGLGVESLRETHLTLQHTWGVPVIPGSALKGVASTAAHRVGGPSWRAATEHAEAGEDHRLLFGDTTRQGVVTFHDAWWIPEGDELPLDLDVMTVHHAGYYGTGTEPPADWDEPNPVAFVTARGSFLVALSGPLAWVDRAAEWLAFALERHGVGGKTRAGYGRFTLEPRRTPEEERIDSIARSLNSLVKQHKGASTARQALEKLCKALDEGVPEAVVRAAARKLWDHDRKLWKDWRKNKASEADREAMDLVGLTPPAQQGAEKPAPPASTTKEKTPKKEKPTEEVAARAWIATKQNRAEIHLELDDPADDRKVKKAKLKDVEVDDATGAALEGTTKKDPILVTATVEVLTKGKLKLRALRPREG